MVAAENIFEEKSVFRVLLKIAPPVMLAQLIQGLYNVVDSFFVGGYSEEGLTALSVIFPLQLVLTAVAVGTGVGVNTLMARLYAHGEKNRAERTGAIGSLLALISWGALALLSVAVMRPFVMISARSSLAVEYAVTYGTIVSVGSIGLFLESMWSKVHQSRGGMARPMVAQVTGALLNIVLDPVLIHGWGPIPSLGVAGAAYATVAGQILAAVIVFPGGFRLLRGKGEVRSLIGQIYRLGYPSILMQSLYTVYIVVLNTILATFSDQAVTVLGLYYKLQTFFFIPLFGLQTCIVPFLSYTYAKRRFRRCRRILFLSLGITLSFMLVGLLCFVLAPEALLRLFSSDPLVMQIGVKAFPSIGASFLSASFSLMMPVFFQAIGRAPQSALLSLSRQIFCLIPLFWGFSRIGLDYAWLAFPFSETIVGALGMILYFVEERRWRRMEEENAPS